MPLRHLFAFVSVLLISSAAACADDRRGAVYDRNVEGAAQVDAVLGEAAERDVPALIVFGANWCHDSRGLAHRLSTHEGLSEFLADHYALAFVDVGERDRNLDQLARFGVNEIYGTPTLVITHGEGAALNAASVHHWRTADNAGPGDLGSYLAHFVEAQLPVAPDASADLSAVIRAWPSYQAALADLDEGGYDQRARRIRESYYEGFARSMARRALGMEAAEQALQAADIANLPREAQGLTDLTGAVTERLADIDMDLIARANRELERYESEAADALTPDQP